MRRVLHVLPHRGGGGEAVVGLLAGLDEFEHRRCYLSNTRKPYLASPSLALGLLRLRSEARQADLLHVVGDTSALLCAPFFRPHPAVWGTHGLSLLRRVEGPLGPLLRGRARTVVTRSERTICSSRQELDELAAIVGPALAPKLVEVPNGIPLPAVPTVGERAAARRRLGLDGDTLVALYLGALETAKRPLDAAAAAAQAAGNGAPVVLLVAGDGPLAGEVAAQGGGAVRALGFEPDPSHLLAAADVFVMPSEREGLALALLEAMGHGLAIVASDGPGNPDAIGDAGLLCGVGDVDALAGALVRLAGDPEERRRLGAAARARAEAKFSLDRFLADMRRVFDAAIAASRPRSNPSAFRRAAGNRQAGR